MKTLKRTLCLVLAVIMVVGVMAIGTSAAALTDESTIQYKAEVGVMNGMGIISGYEDGSFQPTKTVNRAEAAKMICYAMLGKDAADGLVCSSQPFADVATNDWFAPFVSYLATKKVVAGYEDGLFHGGDAVTGLQLAKMLLVANGYGQEGEYEGASWATKTYADAYDKGDKAIFYSTKATDLTAAATREEAALYIYNAICYIDEVKYAPGSVVAGIASSYTAINGNQTLSEKRFNYSPASNLVKDVYVAANSATKKSLKEDLEKKTTDNEYYNRTVFTFTNREFRYTSDTSLIGHKLNVYFANNGDTENKLYYVEDKATVVAKANNDIYTTTTIADDTLKSSELKELGFGGSNNIANDGHITIWQVDSYGNVTSALGTLVKGNSYILISNNKDKTLDCAVLVPTQLLDRVSKYTAPTESKTGKIEFVSGSANDITLEKIGSTVKDSVVYYDGIAKDDYVLVTTVGNTKTTIEKATVVTDTMSSCAKKTVSIGGTSYGYVKAADALNLTTDARATKTALKLDGIDDTLVGTELYNFVLLGNGKVAGYYSYDGTVAAQDYAVIVDSTVKVKDGTDITADKAAKVALKLLLADGSTGVYTFTIKSADKDCTQVELAQKYLAKNGIAYNTSGSDVNLATKGQIVKFTANDDVIASITGMYTKGTGSSAVGALLTDKYQTGAALNKGYSTTGKTNPTDGKAITYTADTIFVFWNTTTTAKSENIKTVTGYKNATTPKNGTAVVTDAVSFVYNSKNQVVFAYVNNKTDGAASDLFFMTKGATTKYTDKTLYAYTGYVNGEVKDLDSETNLGVTKAAPFLYKYTVNGDGMLTDLDQIKIQGTGGVKADQYIPFGPSSSVYYTVTAFDSEGLVYNGQTYTYSNAKMYDVDKDGNVTAIDTLSTDEDATCDDTITILVIKEAPADKPIDLSYIFVVDADILD